MELDKNDVKALIGLLQKLVAESDSENEDTATTAKSKPSTKKTNKKTIRDKRRNSYDEHTNKFLEMPELNMHKSDTAIDKKLNKFPPTPRNRPVSMIDVKCRVCGKEETINSKILPESSDRYKCNSCSQSAG